jgi:hypothetical protein
LLLGICGLAVLCAAQAASGAASSRLASGSSPQTICDAALSQSAVSTIVGYKVPKPAGSAVNIPGSTTNHGISATGTTCEFSKGTSLADLKTTIVITKEATSVPLTAQSVKAGLQAIKGSTVTATSYSGLGGPAIYYTQTLPGGITVYGMVELNGTTQTSAGLYASTPEATIAALVKLGEKL